MTAIELCSQLGPGAWSGGWHRDGGVRVSQGMAWIGNKHPADARPEAQT